MPAPALIRPVVTTLRSTQIRTGERFQSWARINTTSKRDTNQLAGITANQHQRAALLQHITAPCRTFTTTSPIMTTYKIKNLDSLSSISKGEKKEVEVEGIEEGKVLLCNVGGKVSAIGAKCTHFGAPLAKGVLSTDGRLTCPWHGACFSATTGDIESAPALDSLPSFKISEKDGGVYITGSEADIKGSRRKPNIKISGTQSADKVVIVGGGSGAIGALEALRKEGFKGSITVISSEGYLPIDRTKLSKALIPDPAKLALRDDAWFKDGGIDIVSDEVTGVDFSSKKITTKSEASYQYTKLILATGGTPRSLPLPGFKELGNIFLLRNVSHVKNILAAIGEKNKKIVIIGSSFIGLEVANAVAKENDVTVVGMEEVPLQRVMGLEVGKIFLSNLEKTGIKFKMSAGVEKAVASTSDSSKVGGIGLKDGTVLQADLVILGTGVGPATEYLKDNSSINLLKDGSIKTDEHFAVLDHSGVYAIGDIATYPYHGPGGNGSDTRIEHWNVAQMAGRSAAAHIANSSTSAKHFIPIFWSALGTQLRYCGNTVNGWDDLVLKGATNEGKFVAYYCKDETVVAVATMGVDPVMVKAAELMRLGRMPGKKELQDGTDILAID